MYYTQFNNQNYNLYLNESLPMKQYDCELETRYTNNTTNNESQNNFYTVYQNNDQQHNWSYDWNYTYNYFPQQTEKTNEELVIN